MGRVSANANLLLKKDHFCWFRESYGLYMYDLKSVKLTESEAQRHRLERSERKTTEKLDKLKSEKKTLEEDLENVSRLRLV